jgi:BirA family biotin operon repressor/biotin-[acetyl-CoA-carboxylase] ligase
MSVIETDIKGKILSLLRASPSVISGDELARQLSHNPSQPPVSRVSIWKHINKLRELGYPIEVSAKGYSLTQPADLLQPWEFPGREELIRYYPTVDSTMEVARQLAEQGAPHGTVVIAGRQEKGRGRLQRNWVSEDGGLYFTTILRVNLPLPVCYRYNFAAALSLLHTLRTLYRLNAVLKWPNDVLIAGPAVPIENLSVCTEGATEYSTEHFTERPIEHTTERSTESCTERKIAGILSDMRVESEFILYLNIGMGVNLNNRPSTGVPTACSVQELLGRPVAKREFMQTFLAIWETYLKRIEEDDLVNEWKEFTISLNRKVRITTPQASLTGLAVDLDAEGALILQTEDGSLQKIIYGDCHNVY